MMWRAHGMTSPAMSSSTVPRPSPVRKNARAGRRPRVQQARALRERRVVQRLREYCRIAFTAFGVSDGFASSISATVRATTGAAMLVPLRLRYGLKGVCTVPSSR